MKTYFETSEFVTQAELEIFRRIEKAVHALPDTIPLGKDDREKEVVLTCHIIARAVRKVFGLTCVDGFYYPRFSHSWLVTEHGNVIDVYPVGTVGGPILVHRHEEINSPGRKLYQKYRRVGFSKPWFRRAVRIMAEELRKTNRGTN